MADRIFSDAGLAELYDAFNPPERREDFRFYLPLVMSARAVLDVGCGTGALLHRAREAGHSGRLCGLDPAGGMLRQARKRSDVEWVQGDLGSFRADGEFDLAIMTGHAFQVFVQDDELRAALAAVRCVLTDTGRFAFETRNPLAREWEQWTSQGAREATTATGAAVKMERRLDAPVEGGVVRFSHTFTSSTWAEPRVSHSTLRFLDIDSLSSFLSGAGLAIDRQFGDWNGELLDDTRPEIITIARPVES